ncbi:hypothetical protein D3C71_1815190 [compost metagenome]
MAPRLAIGLLAKLSFNSGSESFPRMSTVLIRYSGDHATLSKAQSNPVLECRPKKPEFTGFISLRD